MSLTIRLTTLYNILLEKSGKEQADAIVAYIEEKVPYEFEVQKSSIILKIKKLKGELKAEIEKSRTDLYNGLRQQFWLIVGLFIPIWLQYFSIYLSTEFFNPERSQVYQTFF